MENIYLEDEDGRYNLIACSKNTGFSSSIEMPAPFRSVEFENEEIYKNINTSSLLRFNGHEWKVLSIERTPESFKCKVDIQMIKNS